jgi:hypothetical protein
LVKSGTGLVAGGLVDTFTLVVDEELVLGLADCRLVDEVVTACGVGAERLSDVSDVTVTCVASLAAGGTLEGATEGAGVTDDVEGFD